MSITEEKIQELLKKYFKHMGDNLWAFNPEEEKSPYFSDSLYKDIKSTLEQVVKETEGNYHCGGCHGEDLPKIEREIKDFV